MKLLTAGAPLQITQDIHSEALVLAVSCNRPRIVTLLAAAGAPLTTISSGLSLLQVAWLTPDVTVRVKVLVTRVSVKNTMLVILCTSSIRVCVIRYVLNLTVNIASLCFSYS